MGWLFYALICAFFTSAASLVQKKTLIRQHAMEYSASLAVLTFVLSLPLFFFIDFSEVSAFPLTVIFIATFFGAIAFLLIAKSIRHMEISAASPLFVLGPGISALLAFFILGERLSSLQVLGIGVLIFGSYILELKSHHDFFHPLNVLKASKYVYFILAALLLYGFSSVFDRFIVSRYDFDPIAYVAFAHVFLALHFLIMMTYFHDGIAGIRNGVRNTGPYLLLVAMLTLSYRFAQITAVKMAYLGLVLPIKRVSSLFTTMIGGELFHEHNLFRKSIACVIMIAGVLLVII